jgi:hypothetical protein
VKEVDVGVDAVVLRSFPSISSMVWFNEAIGYLFQKRFGDK